MYQILTLPDKYETKKKLLSVTRLFLTETNNAMTRAN